MPFSRPGMQILFFLVVLLLCVSWRASLSVFGAHDPDRASRIGGAAGEDADRPGAPRPFPPRNPRARGAQCEVCAPISSLSVSPFIGQGKN